MTKNNYEFEILVNGKPIQEYLHRLSPNEVFKTFVEGKKGTTFSLRIRNNSGERILAIPAIDGLSVMNGETASYNSSGYVIKPHSSLTIDGWRTSDAEVAQFYFSKAGQSYAAKIDNDGNVGVIGLVIFKEKKNEMDELLKKLKDMDDKINRQPAPWIIEKHIHHEHCHCWKCNPVKWEWYSVSGGTDHMCQASNLTANAFSAQAEPTRSSMQVKTMKQELGTGWGEYKKSEVVTVEFEKEKTPEAVFEMYYNTREQLEKIGIDFNSKPVYVAPQAFPNQYCKPPVK